MSAAWDEGYAFFDMFDFFEKFGFGDGDMLLDLQDALGIGWDGRDDLLYAVLEAFVVPAWDEVCKLYWPSWHIELRPMSSIHNPVRAELIRTCKNGRVQRYFHPPQFMQERLGSRSLLCTPYREITEFLVAKRSDRQFAILIVI